MMLSTDTQRGEVVIRPPAEIDMATAETFARQIEQACKLDPDRLIIDFEAVTFCDSTTLLVLMSALDDLKDRGGVLVIRNPSQHLRIMSKIMRLSETLGIPPQYGGS